MDMKKILQVMEGASTKPVEGSNDMKKFLSVVKEADAGQPPKGVNYGVDYLQKIVNGEGGRALLSPETAQAALDWLAANPNYTPPAPASKPAQAAPTQTLSQHYQSNPNVREGKTGNGLIKHYFESVQSEAQQAFDQRRAKIKEQARRIAQRMREDAKVSAVDQAKKTITYTDDQTGISTTVPQAMAKPGEGGQVMVDKNQVNQASGQEQQPQPVKVGDMVKMMDTESSSAGVRMHRALQREKEKREFSQRYAEKNFPIGKKPDPIRQPEKDQSSVESSRRLSIGQQMAQDGITYSPEKENELIGLMAQYMKKNGMSSREIRYHLSYDEDYIPDQLSDLPKQDVAEGNEDPTWMNNLRLRK